MLYKSRPETVEAYRFTEDYEVQAPKWFGDMVQDGTAYIDQILRDGAIHIIGCTIYTKRMRTKARCGEYIIRWPDGLFTAVTPREFYKQFREV